eukprot:jgi/Mesvir1/12391/Mv00564-RA.3
MQPSPRIARACCQPVHDSGCSTTHPPLHAACQPPSAILGLDGVGKTSLVLHILQESERTTDATSEAKQATKEGRGGGNPHSVGATSQGWEQRGAQGFLNGVPNGASRVGHQGTAGISTHLSASPGWQPPAPVNGTPPASSQGASVLQGAAWGHGAMGPNGAGPAPPHATPLEGASNCGAHHLLPPGVGSGDGGGAVANGAAVLGTSPGVEASPPFLPAPTTQLMRVQCTVHGIKVTLQEPPAQRSAREQWPKLVRGVDAVLFVVDATDVMRMPVARVELWQLAADMAEAGVTCSIVANKQDLPGALALGDIGTAMNVPELQGVLQAPCPIWGCSALQGGAALLQPIRWLIALGKGEPLRSKSASEPPTGEHAKANLGRHSTGMIVRTKGPLGQMTRSKTQL